MRELVLRAARRLSYRLISVKRLDLTGASFGDDENRKAINTVGLFIHVHYGYDVEKMLDRLKAIGTEGDIYFSVTTPEVLNRIRDGLMARHMQADCRLVPNRGRNFGPLLTAFKYDILKYDLMFHLHEKKSEHMTQAKGEMWHEISWASLLGGKRRFESIVGEFETNLALKSVWPTYEDDIVNPLNHFAGGNTYFIQQLSSLLGIKLPKIWTWIEFPAGGMFAARTSSLMRLLDQKWGLDDFPDEPVDLDGTVLHAIERVIGQLAVDDHGEVGLILGEQMRILGSANARSKKSSESC